MTQTRHCCQGLRRALVCARLALTFALGAALLAPQGALAGDRTEATLGAHAQLRYRHEPAVDDPATGVDEGAASDESGFLLRRARLVVKGQHGRLKFGARVAFERDNPRLLTFYVGTKLPLGLDLRVGQVKRLLTQSYLDSSSTRRMVERAPVGDEVGSNRDVGVTLRGRWWRKRVVAHLALFNGNGANTLSNDTQTLLYEGRLDVHLLRRHDLGDPTLGKKLALRVGAAAGRGHVAAARFEKGAQLTEMDTSLAWSTFVAARWQRFELRAEALWHDLTPVDARADTSTALNVTGKAEGGWSAQLAWQPPGLKRRLEAACRYSRWDDARGDASARKDTLEIGAGWRFEGDHLKLQATWRRKIEGRAGGTTLESWRGELQLQGML